MIFATKPANVLSCLGSSLFDLTVPSSVPFGAAVFDIIETRVSIDDRGKEFTEYLIEFFLEEGFHRALRWERHSALLKFVKLFGKYSCTPCRMRRGFWGTGLRKETVARRSSGWCEQLNEMAQSVVSWPMTLARIPAAGLFW